MQLDPITDSELENIPKCPNLDIMTEEEFEGDEELV